METSGGSTGSNRNASGGVGAGANGVGPSRRYARQFSPSNFIRAPISMILEYSGILRRPNHPEHESLIDGASSDSRDHTSRRPADAPVSGIVGGEVSIRIIGSADQDSLRARSPQLLVAGQGRDGISGDSGSQQESTPTGFDRQAVDVGNEGGVLEGSSSPSSSSESSESTEGETGNSAGGSNRDSSYQRYDIQQAARWIEQILPFSLLLLVVFIRQHLQGFFVTIWIAAVLFKSNDILRKQTALKGERKISILVGITILFTLHVVGVYWWYRNEGVLYPLAMLPPKEIPPFWHVIFLIMLNDTMVRQAAMVLKCLLLIYYKNGRGPNYRRQGQMLTLVEYLLLLYRALLPTPVWYRFFLNKEYGSLFSSLTTGLYLTFKLTSVVEKVQSFIAALKALSRKEVHYGCYATTEQVVAAGDMCAICQEKMHAPILLRCKHIFCEDCVSEWFERERTCPLCRATVKPADLRSFGDGSTSLFFQLF